MGIDLKPAFVNTLLGFKLTARGIYYTGQGIHKAKIKGSSLDFYEHRPYTPFDEIKKINWKAYARTDRYLVKEYEAETNIEAYIVLDSSNSMGFYGKFDFAAMIAYGVSYVFIKQYDRLGFLSQSINIAPSSSLEHLSNIYSHLKNIVCRGVFSFPDTLKSVSRKLIIFISDLMIPLDDIINWIKHLNSNMNVLRIIRVLSREERDFEFTGRTTFIDSETLEKISIEQINYKKELLNWIENQDKKIMNFNSKVVTLYTDITPAEAGVVVGKFLSA